MDKELIFKLPLLPHWCITDLRPALYDVESATAIGQTTRIYGAMQKLIESYNLWIDDVNKTITDFNNETNQDIECFKRAITELCNNYIGTMDMKIEHQDRQIEETIVYMKENIYITVKSIIDEMKESGELDEAILSSFESVDTKVSELETLLNGEVEKIFSLQQDNILNKQEISTNKQNIEALKNKVNTLYFDNVVAMKNSTTLNSGDTVQTLGYYEVNDGGAALYKIRDQKANDVEDGLIHILNKGLVAELIIESITNPKMFGAIGDGVNDDTEFIQTCLNNSNNIIFKNEIYKVNTLEITNNKHINFNNCTLITESSTERKYLLKINGNNNNLENLFIETEANKPLNYSNIDNNVFSSNVFALFIKGSNNKINNITSNKCFSTIYFNDGESQEECKNNIITNIKSNQSQVGLYTTNVNNSIFENIELNMSENMNLYCHGMYIQKNTRDCKFNNITINCESNAQYGGIDIHNNDNIEYGAENLIFSNCRINGNYDRIIRISNAKQIYFNNLITDCLKSKNNYLLSLENANENIKFNNSILNFTNVIVYNSNTSQNSQVEFNNCEISSAPKNLGMIRDLCNIIFRDCKIKVELTNRGMVYICSNNLLNVVFDNCYIESNSTKSLFYSELNISEETMVIIMNSYIKSKNQSLLVLNYQVGEEIGEYKLINNILDGDEIQYIAKYLTNSSLPTNVNSINNNII